VLKKIFIPDKVRLGLTIPRRLNYSREWFYVRPHPDPLPQEREQPSGIFVFSNTLPANPTLDFSNKLETILPLLGGEGRGEGGRSNKINSFPTVWCLSWLFLFLSAFIAPAQTSPPPVSYFRSYVNDLPDQPQVTISVTGAVNVACFTIEETLPGPATPKNISGGGVWVPASGAIRWGPFFNTVATNVSYRLTGPAGNYPVNGGAWMDGQWYFSPGVTMVTVLPAGGGGTPSPPPQVGSPIFAPASGAIVPTNVTISCTTTGAVIYYTLDGSLPTQSSTLYTGAVSLVSVSTLRAVAFTNGWTPSVASVAYYGPQATPAAIQVTRSVNTNMPTAPMVTFSLVPGTNAACVAVTESLPLGLGATNVTSGGNYIASNNVVVWGPFFGTNIQTLSYQAIGQPGTYPVQATWSVDGVGGGEAVGTNIMVASSSGNGVPTAPPQVAPPTFTPASGSTVPVTVAIADATPGVTIYYTLDGSLPTQLSTLYTGAVHLVSASTIRAGHLAAYLYEFQYQRGWHLAVH
jgi:Chitobiase/beta-hexosaminidase C-terminal domain